MDQIILFFIISFYFRLAVSYIYIFVLSVGNFIWPEYISCENYEILFYRLLNTSISDRYLSGLSRIAANRGEHEA